MRLLSFAASVALALWVGGCGVQHGNRSAPTEDRCPPLPVSDPPYGSADLLVLDRIDNLAPPGSPLKLRPESRSDNRRNPGVCVDAATGDIHLYGSKVRRVTFLLNFNPMLAVDAIWPTRPTDAIQLSESPNGPWRPFEPSPGFYDPRTLQLALTYEHGRRPYYYRLQYVDPNDPDAVPHPIEAVIYNH